MQQEITLTKTERDFLVEVLETWTPSTLDRRVSKTEENRCDRLLVKLGVSVDA